MNLLDVIIIILLIAMIIRGSEIGFIRQFFATLGFVSGLLLGAWVTPYLLKNTTDTGTRAALTILMTFGCALLFLSIGEYLGLYLKKKVLRFKVNKIDNVFGSFLGVLTLFLTVWLAASVFIKLPYRSLQSEIQQSVIIGELDKSLPPAPSLVSKLGHIIAPNGFPQVFVGNEPAPSAPVQLPTPASFTAAVNADSPSVVQIEGYGCGGIVEGSGFIAANDLIITNAHVVAGAADPFVIDSNGKHPATPIWFDPNLDLAVLRTNDLAGKPLSMLANDQPRGTEAEVMGYPGGGPLTDDPAAILDEFIASGRNIYNQGSTDRDIYEIQANVIPGNSGGPLINSNGDVIGIVFAQSTVYPHVGYALTLSQPISEFRQAEQQNQTVGTGNCAE